MFNGKVMIINLIVGLIKKTYIGEYLPKPKPLGKNVKVKLDLSKYVTKADLKNATGVDTTEFATGTDLASLEWNVDELDINKLKTVPIDLSKLSTIN